MKEVTTQQLEQMVNSHEQVNIVDVRENEEVAQGKIPGAKHIPLGDVPERLDELNQNNHYYMICRSGGRSAKATELLESNGYDATNIDGGMLAWNGRTEV
ncbi:rhodanese-like domain-containing protein [Barrientosiimonas marina]|uniref:Rhodanese-like domain-containing protein n=1 Tax=Lentibacillus kimchii TaxID=1542911 RepID=A0ABW2USU8_9BACI